MATSKKTQTNKTDLLFASLSNKQFPRSNTFRCPLCLVYWGVGAMCLEIWGGIGKTDNEEVRGEKGEKGGKGMFCLLCLLCFALLCSALCICPFFFVVKKIGSGEREKGVRERGQHEHGMQQDDGTIAHTHAHTRTKTDKRKRGGNVEGCVVLVYMVQCTGLESKENTSCKKKKKGRHRTKFVGAMFTPALKVGE